MNRKNSAFLANLIALLVGVALVALHDQVSLMRWIVIAMGLMFLVPAAVSLIITLSQISRRAAGDQAAPASGGLITTIGCICFGILLIIRPLVFIEVLVYLFAVLLIVGGIYHVIALVAASRSVPVGLWLYILPAIVALAGFALLLSDIRDVESTVNLITGIALICFAVASFSGYLVSRKAAKVGGSAQSGEES